MLETAQEETQASNPRAFWTALGILDCKAPRCTMTGAEAAVPRKGENTETASPDFRQTNITHFNSSIRLKMQALSWLPAQETPPLFCGAQKIPFSWAELCLGCWCFGPIPSEPLSGGDWIAQSVWRFLFLPTKCPARQHCAWDTNCPSRTTGYQQGQGQPTGKPFQTKLLTSLLVIPPSQTLGAISSMSQVPISFASEAQNFHSSSPEGKTGRCIFFSSPAKALWYLWLHSTLKCSSMNCRPEKARILQLWKGKTK